MILRRHSRPHNEAPVADHFWLTAGVGSALFFVTTTLAWLVSPARLLYEGYLPAPPYRWVHPPGERANDNQRALAGNGTVPLGSLGLSLPRQIETDDAQAIVTFPSGVVSIQPGQSAVMVAIVPQDPARGAPAPAGLRFDGNAYRIKASYAPSASEIVLAGPVTVVLRYPLHATTVLRSSGTGWAALSTIRYPGSLEVLATSDQLGVFVAATASGGRAVRWVPYLPAAAGLAAAIAGALLIRRRGQLRTPTGGA